MGWGDKYCLSIKTIFDNASKYLFAKKCDLSSHDGIYILKKTRVGEKSLIDIIDEERSVIENCIVRIGNNIFYFSVKCVQCIWKE